MESKRHTQHGHQRVRSREEEELEEERAEEIGIAIGHPGGHGYGADDIGMTRTRTPATIAVGSRRYERF